MFPLVVDVVVNFSGVADSDSVVDVTDKDWITFPLPEVAKDERDVSFPVEVVDDVEGWEPPLPVETTEDVEDGWEVGFSVEVVEIVDDVWLLFPTVENVLDDN